ncbi:YciI family protein [Amycolatopsis stemonae]
MRVKEFYHRIMYIALLTYTAPETEVDYALPDHADWLRKQFTKGVFLLSGKGNGAADQVILTRSVLRGKLDAVLASDPFVTRRLARYEVIEFTATRTAQELLAINEAIAS